MFGYIFLRDALLFFHYPSKTYVQDALWEKNPEKLDRTLIFFIF